MRRVAPSERRDEGQVGSRNGYERGRVRTAEGPIEVAVPQVRAAAAPFRSSLMSFLDGNSEVLERLGQRDVCPRPVHP